uniref:Uncharacterized protein n=1 Tax=Arundo donax TaxID=35708 RepID=A0A0A9GJS3_ARUDO
MHMSIWDRLNHIEDKINHRNGIGIKIYLYVLHSNGQAKSLEYAFHSIMSDFLLSYDIVCSAPQAAYKQILIFTNIHIFVILHSCLQTSYFSSFCLPSFFDI